MSQNGSGKPELAKFTDLQTDENGDEKNAEIMKFLEGKLKPEDYAELQQKLGISGDITNAELLKRLEAFLAKKKEEEEEPEEKEMQDRKQFMSDCMKEGKTMAECAAAYKEKYPKKAETFLASYKDYMSKCMKDGKSLKECADAWKKKYPEPSKKEAEEAGVEELAKELAKKKKPGEEEEEYPEPVKKAMELLEKNLEKKFESRIKDLEGELETVTKAKELAEVQGKVSKLVAEKHLSPKQAPHVLKLAAALPDTEREELLKFFETTQTFTIDEDIGQSRSQPPGVLRMEISPERRAELVQKFGLQGLIEDRADKTKPGAWWRDN